MSQSDVAISVDRVSKTFKLPHEKHGSIKSIFVNLFKGKKRRTFEKQEVLKDISFEIKKGEFFGIVGRNGSGKSTLLKLLAGIYSPNKGAIRLNGKLTPFIELGVGFNPDLTGRENVYLNGALLGFDRKEMDALYDEIVEFAELEKFMDQKLKNYSSGMQVRLAFSIAIRADTEILLLDEVLAVGDENFQRKCYSYFGQLKRAKKTVILVSHDMSAIRDYCTSGLLLDRGEIIESGNVSKIVKKYTELNIDQLEKTQESASKEQDIKRWGNGDAAIEEVCTMLKGRTKNIFKPGEEIEVVIKIKANKDIQNPVVGMVLLDQQGRTVFATNTKEMKTELDNLNAGEKIYATFKIPNIFTNDNYSVSCAIASNDRAVTYSRAEEIHEFSIAGWHMPHSITHPEHQLEVSKE